MSDFAQRIAQAVDRLSLYSINTGRTMLNQEQCIEIADLLHELEADLRAARASAAKLNRRCQEAESKLVKAQRQPITDRSGSNLVRELVEVRAERDELKRQFKAARPL